MNAVPAIIPYEKQADVKNSRTCGAACLSMVYRSFGKDVPQAEIWPAISKVNRFGSLASTTHLMTQDALGRGFAAVAIQARHPIQALRLCREAGLRAILNHRMEPMSPAGHYSVLVDLDSKNVVLHDPQYGPSRSISHADLLDLWQPKYPNAEIVGGVLIAIAEPGPDLPPCMFCRTPTPPSIACPNCGKAVGLKPGEVLGCMNQNCIARMWNYLCCPACDFMWNFDSHLEPASAGAAGPAPPQAPLDADDATKLPTFQAAMESLDEFVNLLKSIPQVAANADIHQQLGALAESRVSLLAALAQSMTHIQMHRDQLATFVAAADERRQAHGQRMAEVNQKAEPLDGVALGKALLKNLGFTS